MTIESGIKYFDHLGALSIDGMPRKAAKLACTESVVCSRRQLQDDSPRLTWLPVLEQLCARG